LSLESRVLIIGGGRRPLLQARELGLETLLFQRREDVGRELEYADYAFVFDYRDRERLLSMARAIGRAFPVRHVLSFTEWGLEPAALVQETLGLAGNPVGLARLLRDKREMRRALDAQGLSPVAWREVGDAAGIREFLAAVGGPVIAKPADGTASRNVCRVDAPAEAEAACRALKRDGVDRFLVEEYLPGPEVSVETVSAAGHHWVVAITGKSTLPNFVEVGHVVPAGLEADEARRVRDLVTAALDGLGLAWGPAHTEVRLTPRGPRIIETHNRVGGDKIPTLVRLACGVDLYALTLRCLFDLPGVDPPESPPPRAAAVRFFIAPPGTVRSVRGLDEVRAHPAVHEVEFTARPGDRVAPVRDSRDRLGYVIVRADSAEEADRLSRQLVDQVVIDVATEGATDAATDVAGDIDAQPAKRGHGRG